MRKLLSALSVMFMLFSASCTHIDMHQPDVIISEKEAIKIANHEITRRGQDLDYLSKNKELTVIYNQIPLEYFMPNLKDYISSSDYFKNKYKKLQNRNYWSVCYHHTDVRSKGGSTTVIIDAENGEILHYEIGF